MVTQGEDRDFTFTFLENEAFNEHIFQKYAVFESVLFGDGLALGGARPGGLDRVAPARRDLDG